LATRFKKFIAITLLSYACAHAYGENAFAQFSEPWDPDFSEQPATRRSKRSTKPLKRREAPKPRRPRTQDAAPPAVEGPVEIPDWIRDQGPFHLFERERGETIFSIPASTTTGDFGEFLNDLEQDAFSVEDNDWQRMRDNIEQGSAPTEGIELPPLDEDFAPTVVTSSSTPAPPAPQVELPTYGTSLSITGRKVIGFNFSQKRFLRDQATTGRPKSTNLVDIDQQLQLRMQGKVGPKITVNVDYDDTKTNKQDISVVYTGDPNEVVQNASFGDIDLSLPATEFVSYNKQLFGIRVNLKYKRMRAIFVGSRTKGTTKTKQFRGNTQFITLDINDSNYVRRRYYDLSFGDNNRLPITPGSERLFRSLNQGGTPNVNEITLSVDDLNVVTSTFTDNRFVELAPGIDYTIDYVKGILTFRNIQDANSVLAIDFVDATGSNLSVQTSTNSADPKTGTGRFKMIKTPADVQISTPIEAGHLQELKTFYSIGRSQIVRDDGRGNFFLRVLDTNRTAVGGSLAPSQTYPETIEMDFENGLFQIDEQFGTLGSTLTTPNAGLYAPVPISQGLLFSVEFRFRLRTFFLEPSLVLQSEAVLLDGVRLTRNVDYFIDYESGFLTFFNEQRIRPDSVIDVTYEVAPFAGVATESLLGMRMSYDIIKNNKWSVGSTMLFQTGSKPPSVPTINELSESLLIYEGDTQIKDVRLFGSLRGSFQAEIAQSKQNPNLSGKAIVENMEGVKQEDSASSLHTAWQFSSNPGGREGHNPGAVTNFTTEDVLVKEINPNAQANDNDSQKVLSISYDFAVTASTEISIVFPFSITGLDFSQKNILEIVMNQTALSNNEINFKLGGIAEDADGDGVFDTEDINLDKILQPDEDNGFVYNPVTNGGSTVLFPDANNRIDSEDLNNNSRLDPADFTGDDLGYAGGNPNLFNATDNTNTTFLNFTGWKTFQIPLPISTATFQNWVAIKQIRISIRKRAGGLNTGTLRFARVAAVGNTWNRGEAGDPATGQGSIAAETLTVNAVNNVDNPGTYVPIFSAGGDAEQVFNDLFGSREELQQENNADNLQEQALELRWSGLTAGTTIHTRRTFSRAIDISQHSNISFLVFGNVNGTTADLSGEKTFFLRAGSNASFFEAQVPITFTGWKKITIRQDDITGDQVPDVWIGETPGVVTFSTGTPSLQNIGQFVAGVYSTGNTQTAGAVHLNEIHVTNPLKRTGNARKLQMDFTLPGWGTFGAKYRFVDRNFQTPTTLVSNQDNRQDSAYMSVTKVPWFPVNFNISRSQVTTANTNAVGNNSNLVGILSSGKVTTWNGSAKGTINYKQLPSLSLGYDRNRIEYDALTRLDDRQSYDATLGYGIKKPTWFKPRTVDVNYKRSTYKVAFESLFARTLAGNFNTDELSQTFGGRLTFAPFKGAAFNPTFQMTKVSEDRTQFFSNGTQRNLNYDKSLNQQMGFTSSWQVLRWLKPSVSYNITTIENNILNISTFIVRGTTTSFDIGEIKTINRNASGNISVTLNIAEIFRKTKLFRSASLTNSYQLQDGDVWNNVESGLKTNTEFWVRTPLRPTGGFAERQNLTLRDTYNSTQRWSPLEAYALKGRRAAFKTLNITNNFVRSIQRTEVTNTPSKTVSTTLPDLIASLSQMERLLWADRWIKNLQMNLKHAQRRTVNVGISRDSNKSFGTDLRAMVRKKYDTSISFNLRTTKKEDLRIGQITQTTMHRDATLQTSFARGKFRMTPKVDYAQDVTELGSGVKSQDTTTLTPSLLMRADLNLPRGLALPFMNRTLAFTNRIIWTTTLSMAMRSSPVTIADNSRLLNLTTNADYEIAKNLRMTLNAAMSRLWHKKLKENEFISYQFGTTLTFQF
jgi:hypothetical protein